MKKRISLFLVVAVVTLLSNPQGRGQAKPETNTADPANPSQAIAIATAATAIITAATPAIEAIINRINFNLGMATKSSVERALKAQKQETVQQIKTGIGPVKSASDEVNIVRQFVRPSLKANERIAVILALIPDNPTTTNVNDALWAKIQLEWDVAQPALEELKQINVDSILGNVREIELSNRLRKIKDLTEDERIRITGLIRGKDVSQMPALKQVLERVKALVADIALVTDTELRLLKKGIDDMAAAMDRAVAANPPTDDE